jgi:CubicO group peptidase (beta-lactamase class C family)
LIPEFISFPNYFDFDEDSSYFIRAKVGSSRIYRHSHIAEPYAVAEQDPDNIKFCIASITKLFTVLAVILSKDKISWEGCIKEYVPELQGEVWNDVTIGALAAHTSGLGKFVSFSRYFHTYV